MTKADDLAREIEFARQVAGMGLVPEEKFAVGKKIKIRPVRIGMPGTREEGIVFGEPKRDTPYPIDSIKIIKDRKSGNYFVALYSSKAGSNPITYRILAVEAPEEIRHGPTPSPTPPLYLTTPYPVLALSPPHPVVYPTAYPVPTSTPTATPPPGGKYNMAIILQTRQGEKIV